MQDRLALTSCQEARGSDTITLEEWIGTVSRSDRSALESYLIRLMQHVIKWKVQPERRSRSWCNTIYNSRNQIQRLQQRRPSLNRYVIEQMWNQVLQKAQQEAEREIQRTLPQQLLTWQEVFEDVYSFEG